MYKEIINEIRSNLGGNKDLDKAYLISQLEKYADHEYGREITKEIGRMLWDCMTDEEKEEYGRISDEENPIIDILEEVFHKIEDGDLRNALNTMDSFMKNFHPMYQDDKVNEYHSFTSPLEEKLFEKYIGAEKEVRLIPENQPYTDLYYVYGYLLLEFEKMDEAEENLKKALKINPVSSRILLELSEIYKKHTPSFNQFVLYTEQALRYAYYPQDIARCYRNLGYYYIEENQLKTAAALLKYSMKYEMSPMAYSELHYIQSKGFDIELSDLDCERIIIEKNIQLGPNLFIMDTIDELIENYENENAYAQAIYFYEILYDLTLDMNVIEKIKILKEKL